MKKLFSAFLLCVLAIAASAQQNETYYGVKAGFNLSDLSAVPSSKMKPGFYLGGFAESFLINEFSLQIEAAYSRQGNIINNLRVNNYDVKRIIHLDYLNIVVLGKFYPAEAFSLNAGLQAGMLLNNRIIDERDGSKTKVSYNHAFQSADLSVVLGASYKILPYLEASARYNLGITKVVSASGLWSSSVKNRVIQVGLGYIF